MQKKVTVIGLILILFLVGCTITGQVTAPLASENTTMHNTEVSINNSEITEQQAEKTNGIPKRNFELKQLQDFLTKKVPRDSIYSKDPFSIKLNGPQSLYLSESKIWGIYQINRISDFIDEKSFKETPKIDILEHYNNRTDELYNHLSETEFKGIFTEDAQRSGDSEKMEYYIYKYNYEDYLKDSAIVGENIYEEPIITPRGAVEEYRITQAIIDDKGRWTEKWKEPIVLYKIPCTSDIVIYFKPESIFHRVSTINLKPEQVQAQWKTLIDKEDRKILFEEIMNFCGIEENKPFEAIAPKQQKNTYFTNNEFMYYKIIINSSFSAEVKVNTNRNTSEIVELTMSMILSGKQNRIGNNIRIHAFSNESGRFKSYNDWQLKKIGETEETETYKTTINTGLADLTGENITLILVPYFQKKKEYIKRGAIQEYDYDNPKDFTIGKPFYLKVR